MSEALSPDWSEFLQRDLRPGRIGLVRQVVRHVVKRDGTTESYNREKIRAAVAAAFEAVAETPHADDLEELLQSVEVKLAEFMSARHPNSAPAIEEIQDIVETVLVESSRTAVAKAYILYRARHEAMRDTQRLLLDINSTMDGYLSQSDWRVNENANVNFSLGGLILHNSGTITANYWLRNIYPEPIAQAHRNADLHIHDLSMFSGYCAGWSLRQLIAGGLGGVPDKITSKPAKHLNTLIQQIVNFLGIMQNEWAGAQAFSSFDTYLAPFVKIDALDLDEVRQSIQSFIFGVNTPSRWGSQAPFTNVTLDWIVPNDLAGKPAVVAGVEQEFTYGDCQAEMDLINRAFIELMLAGDADGRGFQYPIPTYNITHDFDWESDNAKLLFEMTARYGTPYFQNFINSDLDPGDVRSMCCRLQLDKRELRKRGGGLFGSDEFTGSIGVVTINLPRIGFLAANEADYFARLDHLMDLAAESLAIKRKVIGRLLNAGLFPYTRRYLSHLDNHFSTIGLVGMNESLLNFLGTSIVDPRGREFALRVLGHMRERLADYQERTGDLYNLEATPAESTSYRLARHDRETFPTIITSGEADPYYTNSSQLPVDVTSDIFDALDLQDELQAQYTGGTVFHGFLGEQIDDWRSCASLVKSIAHNYRLPYFTISPTFSVCPEHGYLAGEKPHCPTCGTETEIYTRIVGYYRSLKNWNRGKREEYRHRVTFAPVDGSCGSGRDTVLADDMQTTPGALADPGMPGAAAGAPAASPSTPTYAYYFRSSCPNCPPVAALLDELRLPGERRDVDTDAGMHAAIADQVLATPTVVFRDAGGREVGRAGDVRRLRAIASELGIAFHVSSTSD